MRAQAGRNAVEEPQTAAGNPGAFTGDGRWLFHRILRLRSGRQAPCAPLRMTRLVRSSASHEAARFEGFANSIPTGQWSEPMISGKIFAAFSFGRSAAEQRK